MTGKQTAVETAPNRFWLMIGPMFLVQGSLYLLAGLVGFRRDPSTDTVAGSLFVGLGVVLLVVGQRRVTRRRPPAAEPQLQTQTGRTRQRRTLAAMGLVYGSFAVASLVCTVVTGTKADGVQVVVFSLLSLAALRAWRRVRRLSGTGAPD